MKVPGSELARVLLAKIAPGPGAKRLNQLDDRKVK